MRATAPRRCCWPAGEPFLLRRGAALAGRPVGLRRPWYAGLHHAAERCGERMVNLLLEVTSLRCLKYVSTCE